MMMMNNRHSWPFTSVVAGLLLLMLLAATASVAQPLVMPTPSSSGPLVAPPPPPLIAPLIAPLYIIDPFETHSRFEVMFLGFMRVRGKFERTTGTLHHDSARADAPSRTNDAITAIIDSTTLSANVVNANATNKVLRGPEFFYVEKFPTIIFKSSRFAWYGERLTAIDGTLTLLGLTRPVTLTVQKSGCTPAGVVKRARCTADAFLNVRRSDFGMKAWSASVSDEVKIIVELVAYLAAADLAVEVKSEAKLDTRPEAKPETKKSDDTKEIKDTKASSTGPFAQ